MGLLLHSLRQPYVIGYLVAGIILGPHGIAFIEDETLLSRLDAIGVVMLLLG
jgi:CPA2 family monovalent cation:H+ antiporter-2